MHKGVMLVLLGLLGLVLTQYGTASVGMDIQLRSARSVTDGQKGVRAFTLILTVGGSEVELAWYERDNRATFPPSEVRRGTQHPATVPGTTRRTASSLTSRLHISSLRQIVLSGAIAIRGQGFKGERLVVERSADARVTLSGGATGSDRP